MLSANLSLTSKAIRAPLQRRLSQSIRDVFSTMTYGPAPEDSGPAKDYIDSHGGVFGAFVNGEWVKRDDAPTAPSISPCDGSVLAHTMQASTADVDDAVAAARAASKKWRDAGCTTHARHLYAVARNLQKHSRLLATLESLDNGKPIRETRDSDIPLAVRHFYHHAGWAQIFDKEMKGYEPLGVIAQIVPWNFPLLMLAWKIAPALAMGNTVLALFREHDRPRRRARERRRSRPVREAPPRRDRPLPGSRHLRPARRRHQHRHWRVCRHCQDAR